MSDITGSLAHVLCSKLDRSPATVVWKATITKTQQNKKTHSRVRLETKQGGMFIDWFRCLPLVFPGSFNFTHKCKQMKIRRINKGTMGERVALSLMF